MNSPLCHDLAGRRRRAAFTLTEMMVATAIAALVVAGTMTTFVMAVKGFAGIANYVEIHRGGRKSVDLFARDMRGVYTVSSFSSTNLTVVIPTAFSSSGSVTSNKTVSYAFGNGQLTRTDSGTGVTKVLSTNITALTFTIYDHLGNSTAVLSSAKGVQVDVQLRKATANQQQTEDYLSARYDMRNIP